MHSKKARVTDRMGVVTLGDTVGHFVVGNVDGIGNYAIIKNASWWIENLDPIIEWLEASGIAARYKHEGMVLTFEEKEDLALFLLRWG